MAISLVGGTADLMGLSTSTTLTFSKSVGSGSNRALFIGFWTDTTQTVTGVTYAGQNMTQIATVTSPTDKNVYMYYIVNPTSGFNNIVITTDISGNICGFAAAYTGVSQINPIDVSGTNSAASATSVAITLNVARNNSWVISYGRSSLLGFSSVSGATSIGSTGTTSHMMANSGPTGSGNKTITYNTSASRNMGLIMAAFQASDTSAGFFAAA